MRKYTTHHQPGTQLTFYERQMLGKDWNDRILNGRMPTLRGFAKDHGIAFETWRREYERGRMGERFAHLVKDEKLSPYDARCHLVEDEDFKGQRIPCVSTWYKAVVGCDVFYTHAYASYEKGSVENCNRIVRRWYPKGTDFALVSRADAIKLERTINGIHRLSLGGKTATQYDEELAQAA